MPPPQPRACFGRDGLIEKVIGLADALNPVALIGAGGIGKTSVALAVLHHDRIKGRFGGNRRFIRCDEFPASQANFLRRLSKVIGAGVENPENMVSLRSSLSSEEIFIVLDNAESILDPQGTDGRELYRAVGELSQFSNICLVITSRITTIPPNCETLEVQALSAGAAHDMFYNIYKHGRRSESVNGILKELDFHPLSVALLATVAHQNQWDNKRLVREWKERQTGVLQTEHKASLASTIELSLASPMFKELGPDARGLLGVVAFYPQGIDEDNLDWLFSTISNRTCIFDKFCILSLTYRNNGFITMLAPLRDYLRPKDPRTSPLLRMTKEHYFTRMSVKLHYNTPGISKARWIVTEDVNVEHLLDVYTSLDPDASNNWDACISFMDHIRWHKPRKTVLRKKIEVLPDSYRSKSKCLFKLASLSAAAGNYAEQTSLLNQALKLERERGNDNWVALTLRNLSNASRMLGRYEEGIIQAKESLEIYERLGETVEHARCLNVLARLLHEDGQFDAAEAAILQSIKFLPEKGEECKVCRSHRALGDIYLSRGKREEAVQHYETALGIASSFDWHDHLFSIHFSMAELFLDGEGFEDANTHVEQATSHALDNTFYLGRAVLLRAWIWFRQMRLQDAAVEALRAQEVLEKLGALRYLESCKTLLQKIEEAMESLPPPSELDLTGEFLKSIVRLVPVNSPPVVQGTPPSASANTPHDPEHASG